MSKLKNPLYLLYSPSKLFTGFIENIVENNPTINIKITGNVKGLNSNFPPESNILFTHHVTTIINVKIYSNDIFDRSNAL